MSEASQSSRLLVFQTSKRTKREFLQQHVVWKINQQTTNPHSLTDHQTTLRISIWGFRLVTPKSVLPPLLALLGAWPLQNLQLLCVCVSVTRLLYHDMWNWLLWNNVKMKWYEMCEMMEKTLKKKTWKKEAVSCDTSTAFTIWRIPLQKSCPRISAPLPLCSVFPRSGSFRPQDSLPYAATELDIPIMTGMDHPFWQSPRQQHPHGTWTPFFWCPHRGVNRVGIHHKLHVPCKSA